jgi:uncharacterized protein YjiS (DUF1127 family)
MTRLITPLIDQLLPQMHRASRAWTRHRRDAIARRALCMLDEHGLRDIGLSHRAAAENLHPGGRAGPDDSPDHGPVPRIRSSS